MVRDRRNKCDKRLPFTFCSSELCSDCMCARLLSFRHLGLICVFDNVEYQIGSDAGAPEKKYKEMELNENQRYTHYTKISIELIKLSVSHMQIITLKCHFASNIMRFSQNHFSRIDKSLFNRNLDFDIHRKRRAD